MIKGELLDILLIDDDEATNYLNSRILKRTGIVKSIHVSENGREAIDYLTSNTQKTFLKPDIIFLDINMPVMDGWNFLEAYELLELDKKNVIILMLTTSLQTADLEKAKSSKLIKRLINKPLNERNLVNILEEEMLFLRS